MMTFSVLFFIRSFNSFGAWCSGETDTDQWFQIDLLVTTNVSAVASQGLEVMGNGGHWVTQYSLNFSCDGVRWFSHWFQGRSTVSSSKLYVQPFHRII